MKSALPPILFINLDRDADRRARMQAEFDRLGLPAERLDATLWTSLPSAEQARYYSPALNKRQFHQPLVNGEKGCYASHIRCWQWLMDSAHDAVVVLEDDVALKLGFVAVIQAITSMPDGWDMVRLIGRVDADTSGTVRERVRRAVPLVEGYQLIDYQRIPSLTAGYVLSRSGAAKLLASRLPFGRPIDVDLRHWWEHPGGGLRIQGVMPAAIVLDETSFESSIGDKPPGARWRKFRLRVAYNVRNFLRR